jgi:hypothetical protein
MTSCIGGPDTIHFLDPRPVCRQAGLIGDSEELLD